MLEGLETIDWSTLSHAYGPATDVPGLLRALSSPDHSVRRETVAELFGNIWHQGTVYSATAAAVPFLYDLLAAPDVPTKRASRSCWPVSLKESVTSKFTPAMKGVKHNGARS